LIQKEGKKTALLTLENEGGKWKTQTYYTNENLKDLYKRLDPYSFIRSHQSFIVNLKWIHEVNRYTSESYKIKFKHTEEFALLNRDKLNILMQKIQ
jgi:two-component system, LytTR family, response regulator LytT